jgi:hypothetical protein
MSLTLEEIRFQLNMFEVKRRRNYLLHKSDKYVIPDSYSTDIPVPDEWKTYMQALRDIPSVTEDPANPVWPVQPSP